MPMDILGFIYNNREYNHEILSCIHFPRQDFKPDLRNTKECRPLFSDHSLKLMLIQVMNCRDITEPCIHQICTLTCSEVHATTTWYVMLCSPGEFQRCSRRSHCLRLQDPLTIGTLLGFWLAIPDDEDEGSVFPRSIGVASLRRVMFAIFQ